MNSKKVSISIGALQRKHGPMEALRIAKEIGADGVDFGLDLFAQNPRPYDVRNPESIYCKSDEEIVAYFSELREYADSLGLTICQTHGRFKGFVSDKAVDDILVENIRRDLLATSALGAPVCVVHTSTTLNLGPQPDELMYKLNFDMFTRTIPFAKEYGVKIATETFGDADTYSMCDFFGNIEHFVKGFEDVCAVEDFKDHFTICMDTGHSNKAVLYGQPSSADVIRRLGKNITVLHLNDNNKLKDQHKIPMTGDLDWNDIMDALEEIEYEGYYNMELNLGWFGYDMIEETAAFAIKVMRSMLKDR